LRQFFSVQPTSGNAIPYVAQTGTNNGAAFIGDGVLKPLSDKEITLVEAPVRKVGHHMRLSEELLNDIPALSGFLTTQGIEDLLDIEDNMIFAGANNTTPNFKGFSIDAIKTAAIPAAFPKKAAPNRFDALLAAMAALASRNYVADRILLNPTDLFGMLSQNTGTNDQQNAITFVGGALRIAGYSIETTTAIPAGTFAVANFSRGAGLFQREGISVRLFDQDQDNAVKNLVTVVIEERLAMPIYYPDMFFVDTFANVLTGITV
jgi:HK97 family phage major capsid protein